MQMKHRGCLTRPWLKGLLVLVALGLSAVAPLTAQDQSPGTIEDLANPNMAKITAAHDALKVGDDEVVLYYYRADGKYDQWGFWVWAFPGGDGSANWDKTSKLSVQDGVGYFRFKKNGSSGVNLVGTNGTGWIVRQVGGWTKDGNNDRMVDSNLTNEWVVFANDPKTWPYGAYRPTIDSAKMVGLRQVQIELSGRQALETAPASNGFELKSADGSKSYAVVDAVNASSPNDRNKNWTKRVLLTLGEDADITGGLAVSHPRYQAPLSVNTLSLMSTLAEKTMPADDYQLGALYDAKTKSVEFRLWAPFASAVTVQVYKKSEGEKPDWDLPLSKNPATGVWTLKFDQADPDGFFYEYTVGKGKAAKVVLDPYAYSMDVFRGTGPGRGAIINQAKAIPEGGWQNGTDKALAKMTDAVIYEVSVRDFTIAPEAGTKARPGSYLAFIEKLPYLKSLGITHIQLMPVLNFYFNDETKTAFEDTGTAKDNNYNWGYDPHSYFTPEGWFASDPANPYSRVIELKTLIREAHKAGLGVLFDVVYNHTGKASTLDDVVPGYYYRFNADGSFFSNSGCGNDVASERLMARRLISDSIYYLVKEYNIDGFRFDLMGLIDTKTILDSRARAAKLPNKADVLFEGEGWKMYSAPAKLTPMDQNFIKNTTEVAVFNDEIRSALKAGGLNDRDTGFITTKHINPGMLFSNVLGDPQLNYKAAVPANNLQYIEAHDNLTVHDNIAFNLKLSDADDAQRAELAARIRLGNFFVLTSQGIAFLHSGQESGRTKPKLKSNTEDIGDFIHNSYDAADNINQFVWNPAPEYQALRNYTAGLIAIRNANEVFRQNDPAKLAKTAKLIETDEQLAMAWSYKAADGKTWYLLVNASKEKRSFKLDQKVDGATVLVDQASADPKGIKAPVGLVVKGQSVVLDALTAVMIRK